MRRFVSAVWPILLWMGVIFLMSTDGASAVQTSRILEPLLHWLDPAMSSDTVERMQSVIRKAAHIAEYAVLAWLILRMGSMLRGPSSSRWSWRAALVAFGASAAYGATDEFHQLFVASRGPSIRDVLIDIAGAVLGLATAFAWHALRNRRRGAATAPTGDASG